MLSEEKILAEVNAEAIHLLCRELGLVNTLKFVNQYTRGFGDYTEERSKMLNEETLDELVHKIRQQGKH